jgi:hypothetical protein
MSAWGAAVWGLAGGLCVEALALYSMIRKSRLWSWRKPIPQGLAAYLISVVLRAGAGAALAGAAAGSGQVSGSFAAFALGVAAPLVVEKLSRAVPLSGTVVSGQPETQTAIRGERRDPGPDRPTTAEIGETDNAH